MSDKFIIPEEVLSQHAVALGKTGKGKSSVLRYLVEHLLRKKKRVCVIDPKGDWWGLKYSADGKGPGFPVIAFGNFKGNRAGDVPINDRSGKHVAELISSGNRPCILGFNGWSQGAMTRFWIDFAQTLFNTNSGELYLVGDEFHNFAPKGKILTPEVGMCLYWSNKILSEGRGLGLICLIASQRPQKVHNDSLTCCETLIALGVTHSADRGAVKDWVDGCGDMERGKVVLNSLASLKRGEAYVWSPEIGFGPELVKFPKYSTFDSFAPPQLQAKVNAKGWDDVDLQDVKAKLASVIEEHKANDPAELKKQIAALKKELATKSEESTKTEIKEVPAISRDQMLELEAKYRALDAAGIGLRETIDKFIGSIQQVVSAKAAAHRPNAANGLARGIKIVRPIAERQPAALDGGGHASAMTGTQQKILDTISMLRVRGLTPNREMIARWLSIHPNGGRYGSDLAWLRAQGFLKGCELTDSGVAAVSPNAQATGPDLARAVLEGTEQNIFDQLAGGAEFDRESLAAALGIHPNGGRYGSNLARLRTMGLIPERGVIKLTEAAFS